jgi:4-hydroxybenzoate polyprenyltransferase
MFSKIIAKIEGADVSLGEWIAGFLGIIFIRFFLENFSNPAPSFPAVPDILTMVHYGLFYLAAILSSSLILRLVVPDIKKVSKFMLAIFTVCWLPPIVDLVVAHGSWSSMAYVFASSHALWKDFLTFGGGSILGGVTIGIKVEFILVLCGVFSYVFLKTKNIWKSIGIALLSYVVMFALIALPSFLALPAGTASPQPFLISSFSTSHMAANFIRPTVQVSYGYATEMIFNLGMGSVFYLLDFLLVAGWLAAYRPETARAFLKNIRPGRAIHYFIMIVAGIFFAVAQRKNIFTFNYADLVALAVILVSYLCAWLFAVGVNDRADIAIDRVSNMNRPLVAGSLTESEMRDGNLFFLGWSLLGGFLSGYWGFFTICIFTAAYYIYSAPPLRLKRIPVLATFLIAIACLTAFMSGFYFADSGKLISDFSWQALALILVFFTLFLNVKDIKDIEGDRENGVATIPVVFGEKWGREIVGVLLVTAFLSVPVIVGRWILFGPSLVAAALGYFLVMAKPYQEWKIFVVYFAYLAAFAFALL